MQRFGPNPIDFPPHLLHAALAATPVAVDVRGVGPMSSSREAHAAAHSTNDDSNSNSQEPVHISRIRKRQQNAATRDHQRRLAAQMYPPSFESVDSNGSGSGFHRLLSGAVAGSGRGNRETTTTVFNVTLATATSLLALGALAVLCTPL